MSIAIRVSPYMTIEECSAYTKLAVGTIRRKAWAGEIPARKHGGKYVFHQGEIDDWSDQQKNRCNRVDVPLSRFQVMRAKIRSLKTEDTANSSLSSEKGD